MDNIPTKEELDAKMTEVHALWLKARKATRTASACEEEYKEMRYRYYANGVGNEERFAILKDGDNHVD